MELRQLRYFLTVADELHFGRAAERLHIVQPTVSQQVRRLERELGVTLFDRTTRTVRLTEAGTRFLPHARAVIAAEDRAIDAMAGFRAEQAATIRLGTTSGLGPRLDLVLAEFAKLAPDVHVELLRPPTAERLKLVRSGELDATLVRGSWPPDRLHFEPLWTDALVAALPVAHPLAQQRKIPLADLHGLPLRLPSPEINPPLRALVLSSCREAGFEPALGAEFTTAQDVLATIAYGKPAWTVFYANHAGQLALPGVAFRQILDPEPTMRTYLVLAEDAHGEHLRHLLAACQEAVRQEAARPGGS